MQEGKYYECCVNCNEIFEITKEIGVFHYKPEDDFEWEQLFIEETKEIDHPHAHLDMPICLKCLPLREREKIKRRILKKKERPGR